MGENLLAEVIGILIVVVSGFVIKHLFETPKKELRKICRKAAKLGENGFVAKLLCIYRKVIWKFKRDEEKLRQDLDEKKLRQDLAAVANNPMFRNMDFEKELSYLEIKEKCCELLTNKLSERSNEQIEDGCTRFLSKIIIGLKDAKNPSLREISKQWAEGKKRLEQPKPEPSIISDTETSRIETTHEWVLPPSNLKVPPILIGRENKVNVAREQLLREDVRLLTLTGAGGIGLSLIHI